ncbi:FMNH2-dependent monooxygenase, partial [Streptomyces vinaceus]
GRGAGGGRAGGRCPSCGPGPLSLSLGAGGPPDRRGRLDEAAREPYDGDTSVFTGTAGQLAELLQERREAGLSGFLLRPAVLAHDLPAITRALVPELQRRGLFRREYEADTLRGLLGLGRPANRYAAPPAPVPAA